MESCCDSTFRVLGDRSQKEIGIGGEAGTTANWQLAALPYAPEGGLVSVLEAALHCHLY